MGKGRRREVTGLIVGPKASVPREDVRAFRALLHRLEHKGPAACSWRGESRRVLAKVMGYANYLRMVDPERYADLCVQADGLLARYGFRQEVRHPKKRPPKPPPLPGKPQPSPQQGILKRILGWFGK
jgi:hypothetical protein